MKIMMLMMNLLPKKLRDKMKAPMLQKGRYEAGKNHPIKMNLSNLLICAQHCGTCPSYSGIKGEVLFCASGSSTVEIEQNGCNCITCPLFDKCSAFAGGSTAYFCINGACVFQNAQASLKNLTDLSKAYLQRFMFQNEETFEQEIQNSEENQVESNIKEVNINFIGEQRVSTQSNIPILKASLDAGIPHAHICGGRARCSTCRVVVTEGLEHCRPRNAAEQRLSELKGFSPDIRLACQTTVDSDISIRRLVLDDNDISEAIHQGRTAQNNVGREIEATIMFSDIRSFTKFSEHALPYDVIHILNRYFEEIGSVIDPLGGYIDKYMGDGIMVIFGLDREIKENHAILAARAALDMEKALVKFNQYLSSHFNHEFRIGIGLHSGNVIIGNLGFAKKKEYTAIGDTVNTASRIESLNKKTGTSILASDATFHLISSKFSWGKSYKTTVKGKEEAVIVHELKGEL